MGTVATQVQLKLSLSERLNDLLQSKAARLGVPVTQLVKHLIINDVERENYPMFPASKQVEKNTQEALKQINKAVDVSVFFKTLNES